MHHAKIMTIFALLNIKDLAIGFKICRLGYCSGLGGLNRREERLIEDLCPRVRGDDRRQALGVSRPDASNQKPAKF
jgi:hypothetical protein